MGTVSGTGPDIAPALSGRWTSTAIGAGMASVFSAIAAAAALVASVRAGDEGEAIALVGLAALGLALFLTLLSVAATVVALARHEGYLALSALAFVALTLMVLYLAPALGLWAGGIPG